MLFGSLFASQKRRAAPSAVSFSWNVKNEVLPRASPIVSSIRAKGGPSTNLVYGYPSETEDGPSGEPKLNRDPSLRDDNRLGAFLFMRSVARADVAGGLPADEPVERAERERAEPGVDANEGDHGDLEDDRGGDRAEGVGSRGSSRRGGRLSVFATPPPVRVELLWLPNVLGVAGRRGARGDPPDAAAGSGDAALPGPSGETRGGAGGNPSSTRNANGVEGVPCAC